MSYPEPRYTGETGEISATSRRAGQPAELDYPSGNAVHYLATGATTGLARQHLDFTNKRIAERKGPYLPPSLPRFRTRPGGVGGSTAGVMRYCR